MAPYSTFLMRIALLLCVAVSLVQSKVCKTTLQGKGPALKAAPGINYGVVTNDLSHPRSIIFDKAGHLLVVDVGIGVKSLTLTDNGGTCVSVADTKVVVADNTLNHGIELSADGKTLYASSVAAVFSWAYDPTSASVTSNATTIINGMYNTDHSTRTMLLSKFKPGTMVVNRGSQSNIDPLAANKSTGHGQVKAFDLTSLGSSPYDFTNDGTLLAWGIRNDVGVSEHPTTGGIWTVENSVDDITRDGVDFYQENPAEKLNYMGTLVNNSSPNQGSNFGYPYCYAAWVANQVPNASKNLKTGEQFTIKPKKITDVECRKNRTAPRLGFNAHMAPLDIIFGAAGNTAFVTFHGSHDRPVPAGYKVSTIAYSNGNPVAPSTSRTALFDIIAVGNKTTCPSDCVRPVGLTFDGKDRLYFSSDNTGEIYVLTGSAS